MLGCLKDEPLWCPHGGQHAGPRGGACATLEITIQGICEFWKYFEGSVTCCFCGYKITTRYVDLVLV